MERKSTANAMTLPTLLAIGAGDGLFARCKASASASRLFIEAADMSNAATMAARHRPMVLVLTEDLFAFDPEEFEALARDVRGRLVRVTDDITQIELNTRVSRALQEARTLRG